MAEIFRPAGFDETFERSIIFRHEGKNKRSGIALKRKLKTIAINYLRLIMPLALSRGILLRPRINKNNNNKGLLFSLNLFYTYNFYHSYIVSLYLVIYYFYKSVRRKRG